MKFNSKISDSSIWGISSFGIFFIGLAIWFLIPDKILLNTFLSISLIYLVGLFFSTFNTFYEINSSELKYKSGYFKGKIPIESIQKIDLVHSIWNLKYILFLSFNFSPALGNSGLMIYYDKNNEIYISPEDSEKFLVELLKFNPNIQINNNS